MRRNGTTLTVTGYQMLCLERCLDRLSHYSHFMAHGMHQKYNKINVATLFIDMNTESSIGVLLSYCNDKGSSTKVLII